LKIPNLVRLGLSRTSRPLKASDAGLCSDWGLWKGRDAFAGERHDDGHWEMAGVCWTRRFQSTKRIPVGVDRGLGEQIGRKTIGNKPASGTEIIKNWRRHVRTGKPIVYTSCDSVFQIATHEEVIPVAELYICVRSHGIAGWAAPRGRVIARRSRGCRDTMFGRRGG